VRVSAEVPDAFRDLPVPCPGAAALPVAADRVTLPGTVSALPVPGSGTIP